jgi:hypothetical protein
MYKSILIKLLNFFFKNKKKSPLKIEQKERNVLTMELEPLLSSTKMDFTKTQGIINKLESIYCSFSNH